MRDLHDIRRRHEERTGYLAGFTVEADRTRFPHCVRLIGLDPTTLGRYRFGIVLHRCLRAAARLAPLLFRTEAIYVDHQRVGHEFLFADALTALRFRVCHDAAMRCRPCPSVRR